jgi:hypothetical protein
LAKDHDEKAKEWAALQEKAREEGLINESNWVHEETSSYYTIVSVSIFKPSPDVWLVTYRSLSYGTVSTRTVEMFLRRFKRAAV